ncbi:helix-turn-helix domain-containing protein [Streptomyces chattanoogensis]|uniref:helix-turn-helix domain-containing protein n=1 Tax=Streptomyces chattanoogensis TaxID=66876 RepID=UPI000AC24760
MKAAECGIWKSAELRRLLAEAGLEISAEKMSGLWTGTRTTVRLDDLDAIAHELNHRPCKTHGYRTPAEVCAGLLNSGDALTA